MASVPAEQLEVLVAEAKSRLKRPSEIIREQIDLLKSMEAHKSPDLDAAARVAEVVAHLADMVGELEARDR